MNETSGVGGVRGSGTALPRVYAGASNFRNWRSKFNKALLGRVGSIGGTRRDIATGVGNKNADAKNSPGNDPGKMRGVAMKLGMQSHAPTCLLVSYKRFSVYLHVLKIQQSPEGFGCPIHGPVMFLLALRFCFDTFCGSQAPGALLELPYTARSAAKVRIIFFLNEMRWCPVEKPFSLKNGDILVLPIFERNTASYTIKHAVLLEHDASRTTVAASNNADQNCSALAGIGSLNEEIPRIRRNGCLSFFLNDKYHFGGLLSDYSYWRGATGAGTSRKLESREIATIARAVRLCSLAARPAKSGSNMVPCLGHGMGIFASQNEFLATARRRSNSTLNNPNLGIEMARRQTLGLSNASTTDAFATGDTFPTPMSTLNILPTLTQILASDLNQKSTGRDLLFGSCSNGAVTNPAHNKIAPQTRCNPVEKLFDERQQITVASAMIYNPDIGSDNLGQTSPPKFHGSQAPGNKKAQNISTTSNWKHPKPSDYYLHCCTPDSENPVFFSRPSSMSSIGSERENSHQRLNKTLYEPLFPPRDYPTSRKNRIPRVVPGFTGTDKNQRATVTDVGKRPVSRRKKGTNWKCFRACCKLRRHPRRHPPRHPPRHAGLKKSEPARQLSTERRTSGTSQAPRRRYLRSSVEEKSGEICTVSLSNSPRARVTVSVKSQIDNTKLRRGIPETPTAKQPCDSAYINVQRSTLNKNETTLNQRQIARNDANQNSHLPADNSKNIAPRLRTIPSCKGECQKETHHEIARYTRKVGRYWETLNDLIKRSERLEREISIRRLKLPAEIPRASRPARSATVCVSIPHKEVNYSTQRDVVRIDLPRRSGSPVTTQSFSGDAAELFVTPIELKETELKNPLGPYKRYYSDTRYTSGNYFQANSGMLSKSACVLDLKNTPSTAEVAQQSDVSFADRDIDIDIDGSLSAVELCVQEPASPSPPPSPPPLQRLSLSLPREDAQNNHKTCRIAVPAGKNNGQIDSLTAITLKRSSPFLLKSRSAIAESIDMLTRRNRVWSTMASHENQNLEGKPVFAEPLRYMKRGALKRRTIRWDSGDIKHGALKQNSKCKKASDCTTAISATFELPSCHPNGGNCEEFVELHEKSDLQWDTKQHSADNPCEPFCGVNCDLRNRTSIDDTVNLRRNVCDKVCNHRLLRTPTSRLVRMPRTLSSKSPTRRAERHPGMGTESAGCPGARASLINFPRLIGAEDLEERDSSGADTEKSESSFSEREFFPSKEVFPRESASRESLPHRTFRHNPEEWHQDAFKGHLLVVNSDTSFGVLDSSDEESDSDSSALGKSLQAMRTAPENTPSELQKQSPQGLASEHYGDDKSTELNEPLFTSTNFDSKKELPQAEAEGRRRTKVQSAPIQLHSRLSANGGVKPRLLKQNQTSTNGATQIGELLATAISAMNDAAAIIADAPSADSGHVSSSSEINCSFDCSQPGFGNDSCSRTNELQASLKERLIALSPSSRSQIRSVPPAASAGGAWNADLLTVDFGISKNRLKDHPTLLASNYQPREWSVPSADDLNKIPRLEKGDSSKSDCGTAENKSEGCAPSLATSNQLQNWSSPSADDLNKIPRLEKGDSSKSDCGAAENKSEGCAPSLATSNQLQTWSSPSAEDLNKISRLQKGDSSKSECGTAENKSEDCAPSLATSNQLQNWSSPSAEDLNKISRLEKDDSSKSDCGTAENKSEGCGPSLATSNQLQNWSSPSAEDLNKISRLQKGDSSKSDCGTAEHKSEGCAPSLATSNQLQNWSSPSAEDLNKIPRLEKGDSSKSDCGAVENKSEGCPLSVASSNEYQQRPVTSLETIDATPYVNANDRLPTKHSKISNVLLFSPATSGALCGKHPENLSNPGDSEDAKWPYGIARALKKFPLTPESRCQLSWRSNRPLLQFNGTIPRSSSSISLLPEEQRRHISPARANGTPKMSQSLFSLAWSPSVSTVDDCPPWEGDAQKQNSHSAVANLSQQTISSERQTSSNSVVDKPRTLEAPQEKALRFPGGSDAASTNTLKWDSEAPSQCCPSPSAALEEIRTQPPPPDRAAKTTEYASGIGSQPEEINTACTASSESECSSETADEGNAVEQRQGSEEGEISNTEKKNCQDNPERTTTGEPSKKKSKKNKNKNKNKGKTRKAKAKGRSRH